MSPIDKHVAEYRRMLDNIPVDSLFTYLSFRDLFLKLSDRDQRVIIDSLELDNNLRLSASEWSREGGV